MISKELIDLLIQVLTSWQVIAVTVALILYLSLVFYVGRLHRKPRPSFSFPAAPKKKKKKEAPAESEAAIDDEDLGFED